MSNKLIGWLLTILGILIIIYALYSSFTIFTAQKEAPSLFNLSQETTLSSNLEEETSAEMARVEMEKIIKEQLNSMMPNNAIPKMLNLLSWSIFAGILIFGGSKLSYLGIKLLKQ